MLTIKLAVQYRYSSVIRQRAHVPKATVIINTFIINIKLTLEIFVRCRTWQAQATCACSTGTLRYMRPDLRGLVSPVDDSTMVGRVSPGQGVM